MKTKHFFFLALVLTFIGTQKMNAQNTFLDLGLPSGTLWATCNVGASSPEEIGAYFAWGETSDKSTYAWDSYKYCNGDAWSMKKYCTDKEYGYNEFTDGLAELQSEDDAAMANLGNEWQIPSKAQFEELIDKKYTTLEKTSQGLKITSKSNGHSIILPASGFKQGEDLKFADRGWYWSRSLDPKKPNKATFLWLQDDYAILQIEYRDQGLCVRPVRVQEAHTISDIPDGWKVNGSTTNGTYQAKGGDVLHFTPKNVPAGKRVKSIKVVKK